MKDFTLPFLESEPDENPSFENSLQKLATSEARLHDRALGAAKAFKESENELMEALIAVDKAKVFSRLGYPSLFRYATEALGLSEAVAYCAIAVARKAEQIPALRLAVNSGTLGLSKAKKVVSVLDLKKSIEEHSSWVEKAVTLPSRKLERAVAAENPKDAIPERAVYKSAKRLELMLGISEEILLDFRRAQDRVSGAKSSAAGLEETLQEVLRFYLAHKDPEERAKRVIAKKGFQPKPNPSAQPSLVTGTVTTTSTNSTARKPIPTALLHQIRFRDRGACQFKMPNGKICGARRWIEIHHRIPVSHGGENVLENLISLCSAHHRAHHQGLEPQPPKPRSSDKTS